MLTQDQLREFTKKKKVSETVIIREYLQLLFLSKLYAIKNSGKIFFKGGTAIHLILNAPRFSEDLDFTVSLPEKSFTQLLIKAWRSYQEEEIGELSEKKSTAGKRFLLTANPTIVPYKVFLNLDFSFREKVIKPQKTLITTDYPLVFTSYVHHLSKEELLAEKIRALLTRKKGRDVYDLWYLTAQNVRIDNKMIKDKLRYYGLKTSREKIVKRVNEWSAKDFIVDVRPFVPANQREKLPDFFEYIKAFLKQNL